jgi:hypothetical protein
MAGQYTIPNTLPQPTRYESDGSPTWVFAPEQGGGSWTNAGWIVPLERLSQYIIPRETPPVEPVADVGLAQLKIALRHYLGITRDQLAATINGYINSIPDQKTRDDALDLWEYASIVQRDNAFIISAGAALGFTEGQIDAIFKAALTV